MIIFFEKFDSNIKFFLYWKRKELFLQIAQSMVNFWFPIFFSTLMLLIISMQSSKLKSMPGSVFMKFKKISKIWNYAFHLLNKT